MKYLLIFSFLLSCNPTNLPDVKKLPAETPEIALSGFYPITHTFQDYYSIINWTLTRSPGSNGSVKGTPYSVTITGSNGTTLRTNTDTDLTIAIPTAGTLSFQWHYSTIDNTPRHDIAGVLIDGTFMQLTANAGAKTQRGTFKSAFLVKGTKIGFRVRSVDNLFGAARFTVSEFQGPKIEAVD